MTTKKQNIAVIAVFLCMVFGMTIWTMVMPSREFSERENRALAQMPEPSVESCFSGKFEKDFETYLTDQFPMRDGWISAKTAIEKATFKTESKDIYFADDDYLIEAHSKSFTAPSANANIGYLKNFMETCVETYGKDHATAMVVPNAVDILRDHLPKYASPYDEEVYLQKVADAMPEGTWFDSGSVLREHKNIQLYYRTDHHWTSLGAYYAANALRSSWGLPEIDKDTLTQETVSEDFCGTLYSSSGFFWIAPDEMETLTAAPEKSSVARYETNGTDETLPLYNYDKLTIKDKYTFFLGGNIPRAVVDTGTENAPSLLILRDSYADSLVPFLTDAFSEIHLIDLRYYTGSVKEYIAENAIDRVLLLYSTDNFCSDSSFRIF